MIILVAVIFGLLSLGALTVLTLLAGFSALGLAFVAVLFMLCYLCQAIVAYLGGRWILSRIRPEWNRKIYAPLLIGLLILGLLFAVPIAGGILQFLVVLAGLGAIILAVFQGRPAPQSARRSSGDRSGVIRDSIAARWRRAHAGAPIATWLHFVV